MHNTLTYKEIPGHYFMLVWIVRVDNQIYKKKEGNVNYLGMFLRKQGKFILDYKVMNNSQ